MPLSTSICICICVPGRAVISVTGPALGEGSNALTTFPRPCLGTVEDAADMIPSKGERSGPMSSALGMNDKGSLESCSRSDSC